jgi:hypothetical protein
MGMTESFTLADDRNEFWGMAIISRIKSLVRYDYQSHGILLHPYYKSEILADARKAPWAGHFGQCWRGKHKRSCSEVKICDTKHKKCGSKNRKTPATKGGSRGFTG